MRRPEDRRCTELAKRPPGSWRSPTRSWGSEETCTESQASCPAGRSAGKDDDVQKVVLDVPEIDTQEILGEWLVPHGEALLVSFGAHTVADKNGMAVVKERLAIIEADEAARRSRWSDQGDEPGSGARSAPHASDFMVPPPVIGFAGPGQCVDRAVFASAGGRIAAHRSRGTDGGSASAQPLDSTRDPRRRHAGRIAAPARRRDRTRLVVIRVVRANGQPADQEDSPAQAAKPATDAGTNKVEFTLPKAAAMLLPSLFMPGPSAGFQFLLPMKPLSIKLPFGQRLEIEVIGKVVPETK